jgi:hypothetical protein
LVIYSTYDEHEQDMMLQYYRYFHVLFSIIFVDVYMNKNNSDLFGYSSVLNEFIYCYDMVLFRCNKDCKQLYLPVLYLVSFQQYSLNYYLYKIFRILLSCKVTWIGWEFNPLDLNEWKLFRILEVATNVQICSFFLLLTSSIYTIVYSMVL